MVTSWLLRTGIQWHSLLKRFQTIRNWHWALLLNNLKFPKFSLGFEAKDADDFLCVYKL